MFAMCSFLGKHYTFTKSNLINKDVLSFLFQMFLFCIIIN